MAISRHTDAAANPDRPGHRPDSDRLRVIAEHFDRLLRPDRFPPRDFNTSLGIKAILKAENLNGVLARILIQRSPAHSRDLQRSILAPLKIVQQWESLASDFENSLLERYSPTNGPPMNSTAYNERLGERGRTARPTDFFFPRPGTRRRGYLRRFERMAKHRKTRVPDQLVILLDKYRRGLRAARDKIVEWIEMTAATQTAPKTSDVRRERSIVQAIVVPRKLQAEGLVVPGAPPAAALPPKASRSPSGPTPRSTLKSGRTLIWKLVFEELREFGHWESQGALKMECLRAPRGSVLRRLRHKRGRTAANVRAALKVLKDERNDIESAVADTD